MTTTDMTADDADTGSIPTTTTTTSYYGVTDRDLGDAAGRRLADRWVWEARYVKRLLVIDFGATLIATLSAYAMRFQGDLYARWYLLFSAIIPVVWLGLLALSHAYERRLLFVGTDEYQRVLRSGVRLIAGMALASYVLKADLARGYLLIALVLTTALSLLGRWLLRKRLHRARSHGRAMHRVLVLGHAATVASMTGQLHRQYHHGLQVIGACVPASQLGEAA
ncbi:sugar transferase, partial [Actinoplanes sp. NPDC051633]